jgi:hypothetical protein
MRRIRHHLAQLSVASGNKQIYQACITMSQSFIELRSVTEKLHTVNCQERKETRYLSVFLSFSCWKLY